MANTSKLYQFKDKDPIIDILRTLVETRAELEGVTPHKVLKMLEEETNGEIKAATPYSWFNGPTKYPRYDTVARLYLAMRSYSRRPISIGDTAANPVDILASHRRKVA
jgi:hypothetical protein